MKWIVISILFIGCSSAATNTAPVVLKDLESTDPSLKFKNGIWFYNDQLFSGTLTDRYANNSIHHITGYLNGKEEGSQETFFEDGKIQEKRFYHNGEKDSVHTGWWPNGNRRFEYHFTNA